MLDCAAERKVGGPGAAPLRVCAEAGVGSYQHMSLTVWSNHELRPAAARLFEENMARLGCRLVQSTKSSRSVLKPGEADPLLAGADVAYGQPAPADVVLTPRLRWISISTAGITRYDNEDFRAAMRSRGTAVTNASAVFANPCAEHVLTMMLTLSREFPYYLDNQRGPRGWPYMEARYIMDELTGKTVVILGFGAIGRRLAELLAPFGCRVIGVRRTPRGDEGVEVVRETELAQVLAVADHVVDILPASSESRHFCGAAFFAQLKRGACFYNIGRGSTVDQSALLDSLRSGQVGGAYLDALEPEPLPPEHPLWTAPRCFITPHVAGGHREQDENLVRHFTRNLENFIAGRPLVDRVM
jgi:phosphoglycerate dehydrogenase-like enzyme